MKNYLVILITLFAAIAVNGATVSNNDFNQSTLDLWLSQPANSHIKNVREIEFIEGPVIWLDEETMAGYDEAWKGLNMDSDKYVDFMIHDIFMNVENKTLDAGYHIINVFASADVNGDRVLIFLTLAAFDNGRTLLKFGPYTGPYLTINQRHEAFAKGKQNYNKAKKDSRTELVQLFEVMSDSDKKSYNYLKQRIELTGLDPRAMDAFLKPFRQKLKDAKDAPLKAEKARIEKLNSLKTAAMNGDRKAQSELGYAYTMGLLGLDQNYTEAAKWSRLAAEQGDEDSQVNLGILLAQGYGVQQDLAEAYFWMVTGKAKKDYISRVEKQIGPEKKAEVLNRVANLKAEKLKSILIKETFDKEWRDILTGFKAMIWIRYLPNTKYAVEFASSDDKHLLYMFDHHNMEKLFPALVKWDEWTKAAKANLFRPEEGKDSFYKRIIWTNNPADSHFDVYYYSGRSVNSNDAPRKKGEICKLHLYLRIDKKGRSELLFTDPMLRGDAAIIFSVEHSMGTGAQHISNLTNVIQKIDKRVIDSQNKINAMSRDEILAIDAERNKKEAIQAAPETIFK